MQKSRKVFSVESITFTAMLVALQVVLGNIVQVPLLEKQYNLGFLPIAVAGALLGPANAAIVGGLGDIIGSLIFPQGAYFPGFTLTNVLVGLIYGFVLYKRTPRLLRVIVSGAAAGLVNLLLNSCWLSILYTSKGYEGWLAVRAPSYLVEVPLQMAVLLLTLFALSYIRLPADLQLPKAKLPAFLVAEGMRSPAQAVSEKGAEHDLEQMKDRKSNGCAEKEDP